MVGSRSEASMMKSIRVVAVFPARVNPVYVLIGPYGVLCLAQDAEPAEDVERAWSCVNESRKVKEGEPDGTGSGDVMFL